MQKAESANVKEHINGTTATTAGAERRDVEPCRSAEHAVRVVSRDTLVRSNVVSLVNVLAACREKGESHHCSMHTSEARNGATRQANTSVSRPQPIGNNLARKSGKQTRTSPFPPKTLQDATFHDNTPKRRANRTRLRTCLRLNSGSADDKCGTTQSETTSRT